MYYVKDYDGFNVKLSDDGEGLIIASYTSNVASRRDMRKNTSVHITSTNLFGDWSIKAYDLQSKCICISEVRWLRNG